MPAINDQIFLRRMTCQDVRVQLAVGPLPSPALATGVFCSLAPDHRKDRGSTPIIASLLCRQLPTAFRGMAHICEPILASSQWSPFAMLLKPPDAAVASAVSFRKLPFTATACWKIDRPVCARCAHACRPVSARSRSRIDANETSMTSHWRTSTCHWYPTPSSRRRRRRATLRHALSSQFIAGGEPCVLPASKRGFHAAQQRLARDVLPAHTRSRKC